MKFESKYLIFIQENYFENVTDIFVWASVLNVNVLSSPPLHISLNVLEAAISDIFFWTFSRIILDYFIPHTHTHILITGMVSPSVIMVHYANEFN